MENVDKGKNSQVETESSLGAELEKELAVLQKKDRRKTIFMGSIVAVFLALSVAVYVSAGPNNSINGSPGNARNQLASWVGGTAFGGVGSCCGIGSAGETLSQTEIQQRALDQYEKETGNIPAKGVINDFGCHIQCDIIDDTGVIVASYGYQGGDSLYRIN